MTRQNYYARRRLRQRRQVETDLVTQLVQQERKLQPRLGGRKLLVMCKSPLSQAGVKLGRDRFFELLRERDLLLKPRRSEFPRTTNSYHSLPIFNNRIKHTQVTKPNQVWVGDLTYLRTAAGFLYLALLTDKASRKIVGYHCGDTLEAQGCIQALEMALNDLPTGATPIHHSDRGTQYCSHQYVNRLTKRGLTISMTETNHCAENALAERMNGIIKAEYGLDREFQTKQHARTCVDQAVRLYNTRRPHTALNYRFPHDVHAQSN
jgi:transposase InsO family protein